MTVALVCCTLAIPIRIRAQAAQPPGVTHSEQRKMNSSETERYEAVQTHGEPSTLLQSDTSSRAFLPPSDNSDRAATPRATKATLIFVAVVLVGVVAYWLFLSLDRHS